MVHQLDISCLRDGEMQHVIIPIETPDFEVIPPQMFHGIQLPATSIESQVSDWFADQDHRAIMDKYDMDIIFDWQVYHEVDIEQEFLEYISPIAQYIQLTMPHTLQAFYQVIKNMGPTLYAAGLTHEQRLDLVMHSWSMMTGVALESISRTLDYVTSILSDGLIKRLDIDYGTN